VQTSTIGAKHLEGPLSIFKPVVIDLASREALQITVPEENKLIIPYPDNKEV
jgi:hypothetical protein